MTDGEHPTITHATERQERAVTRRHNMDTRPLRRIFAHANRVAAAAAYVSISHGVRSSSALDTLTYHMVRDGTVRSDITQAAIRRGCAAARNIHEPEPRCG